jgi:hypothetical protein
MKGPKLMTQLRWLKPTVTLSPLIDRWYAWNLLIPPHTAALNLAKRHKPVLTNYLADPRAHASAVKRPGMYCAPFIDIDDVPEEQAIAELAQLCSRMRPFELLAADIDAARRLLATQAQGGPLTRIYGYLPESLRGLVEVVYGEDGNPRLRFFEELLYRSEHYRRSLQRVQLSPEPRRTQPFTFISPVLPGRGRLDLDLEFAAPEIDVLAAARRSPVDVDELTERAKLATPAEVGLFKQLFHDQPPVAHQPPPRGQCRMRYFGHAAVLLETAEAAVLLDPEIAATGDGHDHFSFSDLPECIDAIILSHAHPDHVSVGPLIQLRHRTTRVIVPRSGGGETVDPSLGALLRAVGFSQVTELAPLESAEVAPRTTVTALPFLGEHGDLDIRAKMVPMVGIGTTWAIFANDTVDLDPVLYRRLGPEIPAADALFIGLECVGAPAQWLYGSLAGTEIDPSRVLAGSDAASALRIAKAVHAKQVFCYALGLEPWLRHLTGTTYENQTAALAEADRLIAACHADGGHAELLYCAAERVL